MPARPLVADVVITGNHSVPSEWIKSIIKTRPGGEFKPETLHNDIRELYKTGLFTNVWAGPERTPDEQVIVKFEFIEPVHEVVYDGAKHVKLDQLEIVTGLHKGMNFDPVANRQAVEAIRQHYHDLGRVWASVELVEGTKPDDARVVFKITEGPIVRVSSIEFTGNASVSGARLRALCSESNPFLGFVSGTFNPDVAGTDGEKLETFYRSSGFRDVRVSRELKWDDPGQRLVKLVFQINEGKHSSEKAEVLHYMPGEVDVQYEIEERPPVCAGVLTTHAFVDENMITPQLPTGTGERTIWPCQQPGEEKAGTRPSGSDSAPSVPSSPDALQQMGIYLGYFH